jgi:hypothetical protein
LVIVCEVIIVAPEYHVAIGGNAGAKARGGGRACAAEQEPHCATRLSFYEVR